MQQDPELPPADENALLRSRTVSATLWSVTQSWGVRLLSFVTFVVLSRLLAPEAFGLLAMAMVFIMLFSTLVDSGVSQAVVQAKDIDRELVDTAFWMSTAAGLALALGCVASADLVAALYGEPQLASVLRVLSVALAFNGANAVQSALLTRELHFRQIASRRLLSALLGAVAGMTWAVLSPSVWALVAQYVVSAVVATVVLWKVGSYRPGLNARRRHVKWLWQFGVSMVGIRLFSVISEQGDNFIVGLLLGTRQLGFYAIGYRIYQMVTETVTGALSAVALPTFSRMQDDLERLRRAFLKATRISALAAIPFFTATGVLAPYLIPALFGDKWEPSVPVAQVLSLVGILNGVVFFDRSVLIAVGRVRLELAIVIVATIGNVIAFSIGSMWGIVGVAAALAIRCYLFWPIRVLALRSAVGLSVRTYLGQWVKPVVCGLCMLGAMLAAGEVAPEDGKVAVMAAVGALAYIAAIRVVAPASLSEIAGLTGEARRRSPAAN